MAFAANPACPMSQEEVDPDAFIEVDGKPVYFCCGKCAERATADPEKWAAIAYPE